MDLSNSIHDRHVLRPTFALVDLDALVHNYRVLSAAVAPSKVLAVVKANAYGHGLLPCARALEESGASYFGVATVDEGIALRNGGVKAPILVFNAFLPEQVSPSLDLALELTVSTRENIEPLQREALRRSVRPRIHLEVDTGMRRNGVRPAAVPEMLSLIDSAGCELVGIYSHFACADDEDKRETTAHLQSFNDALEGMKGRAAVLRHIANSAAVLQHPQSYLDMVRPGVALYGGAPAPFLEGRLDLRPVMTVRSKVVFMTEITAGQGVSYGHTWRAEGATRLVTIPIGYADGFLRALSNRGEVLIRGKRYPVVGRVCMDQIVVAVGMDDIEIGEDVVLLGSQGRDTLPASEIAERAATVTHEVFTAISPRVPRSYLKDSAPTLP